MGDGTPPAVRTRDALRRPIRRRWIAMLLACIVTSLCVPAAAAASDVTRLHATFDEYWEWVKRENPEIATFLGDDRYDDRLTDFSAAAIERRKAYRRALLKRLEAFDSQRFGEQDAVSLGVLKSRLALQTRLDAFPEERMPVAASYGPQLEFAYLAKSTPFRGVRDYERYLARLRALPGQLQQVEALMRQGQATGWMQPAAAITELPAQFDPWLRDDLRENPAGRPFTTFPAAIPAAEQSRLAAEGRRAVTESVVPAFRALKSFVETDYVPRARRELGASTLPGGSAYYEALIADRTTTTMSAREIHDLGLREVARIGTAIDDVIRKSGFTGTQAEFFRFVHDAPRFHFTRAEEMLAGYRDIAKRADAQLPSLFAELPRLPYGVRAMEAFEGDNAEHYTPGSPEAGRAGFFEANVNNLGTRPIYDMESVFLHEAVPGHHLQVARAQELKGLPEFRRHNFFVAYSEGWALYAESLGDELGFYTDPYSRFGRLRWEMVRACRLVIDTGIHAFGWDRARAIDYMRDNAGLDEAFAAAEVDRYIVTPGQALGYKLGELRIKALRAKASAALGDRFDVRRFHNALIDDGALPLDVLGQRIDAWIAREALQRDNRPPASATTQH
jgi:uncharacterized protein (DUF885 family)